MNKQRKARLRESLVYLQKATDIVTEVKEDERYSLDNIPENLQGSERCTAMEDAIDELEEAIESIEEATDSINNVC